MEMVPGIIECKMSCRRISKPYIQSWACVYAVEVVATAVKLFPKFSRGAHPSVLKFLNIFVIKASVSRGFQLFQYLEITSHLKN
jgi:hypothetical protein